MKRVLVVLLSLGMLMALSTQASAVDVKLMGEYYVAGMYLDKTSLQKDVGPSTAFYFQRLRLQAEFVVSPGLMLIIRANIMERVWGASRSTPGTTLDTLSAATRAENENIGFDYVYINYVSPVGEFKVGYQRDGVWATVFNDSATAQYPKIVYTFLTPGGIWGTLQLTKAIECSYTANNAAIAADRDASQYVAALGYSWKQGSAGLLGKYIRSARFRDLAYTGDAGYLMNIYVITPYAKVQLGPVILQTEVLYAFGQAAKWEGTPPLGIQADTRIDQLAGWVDATVDFNKFYAGGSIAYVQGEDPGTGVLEGLILSGGNDWNPCLILFNSELTYWAGAQTGHNASSTEGPMRNAWFFQLRGGVKPLDKLDIMLSASYATADKKPAATWLYNDYGWETDLTATYRITNNLFYTLGVGYLFTGKYFKGVSESNEINNNYLVINKLMLTF